MKEYITREIVKAYAGFVTDEERKQPVATGIILPILPILSLLPTLPILPPHPICPLPLPPLHPFHPLPPHPLNLSSHLLSPGNWGCGAFLGDKFHKPFLQYLAASQAGRDMYYCTFKDIPQTQQLERVCTGEGRGGRVGGWR
jgi:hypothetical protein